MPKQANAFVVAAGAVVNVVSTVSLVLLNKWIYEVDGFKFMITLSALHFGFTALMTNVLLVVGFFEDKEPQGGWRAVIPVAVGTAFSVGFMNLNLVGMADTFHAVVFLGYPVFACACRPSTPCHFIRCPKCPACR